MTTIKLPERNSLNDYAAVKVTTRLRLGALAICCIVNLLSKFAPAAAAAAPEEILRAHGLQRVDRTWITSDEAELHERVEELGKLERRLQESKRECDAQVIALEQLRAQLKTAEATKSRLAKVLKTAPAGQLRTMLERDQKEQTQLAAKLKEGLPPADTLGGLVPLKSLFAEQCALRAEFVLGFLQASQLETRIAQQYAELAKNQEILAALAELPNQPLGPAKRFAADQKTLLKYRAVAFPAAVPFYREGQRVRVSLMLNDEQPATLSWHEEHEATLLPYSMVQSLGLAESLPNQQEQLALAKEKLTLKGWFVTLNNIRLGQSVAEKVPVFVLAPEHEALGGRLGYELQQQLLLTLDADRLQIKCGQRQQSSDLSK
jgi:hypothetical protein